MTFFPHPDPDVLAVRTGIHLKADPSRIFARLFVPGQEDFGANQSRTSARRHSMTGKQGGSGMGDRYI